MAVDVAGLSARWTAFAENAAGKAILITGSPASTIKQSAQDFKALSGEAMDLVLDTRAALPDMDEATAAKISSVSRAATALTTVAGLVGDGSITQVPAAILKANRDMTPMIAREAIQLLEANPGARIMKTITSESTSESILEARALMDQIIPALNRRTRNSVVVSGQSGSGRSTAVHALAREIEKGAVPSSLAGNEVRLIQPGQLRAGGATKEDVAKRLTDALNGAGDSSTPNIVFIDRFEDLADNVEAGLIVRNAIEDSGGKLRVVILTNDTHASQLVDKKQFGDYATLVKAKATKADRAIEVLDSKWSGIEAHHGILRANANVSTAAVYLAENYLLGSSGRDLMGLSVDVADAAASKLATEMFARPRAIVDLDGKIALLKKDLTGLEGKTSELAKTRISRFTGELKEAEDKVAELKSQWQEELPHVRARVNADREIANLTSSGVAADDPRLVTANSNRADAQKALDKVRGDKEPVIKDSLDENAIVRYVSETAGIPEETLAWDTAAKFRDMPQTLKGQVFGQDFMVDAVSAPFQRWKAGGKADDKPVGVVFAGGPSGVGKTQLAVDTTVFVYGDEKALIRIPGGDYDDPSKWQSLVGSPQGYVGSDEGGRLTNELSDRPHSMVILDEGDKMHGANYRFMLNLDDTGSVMNGKGYEVDASNAFFFVAGNWMRDEMDMLARNWDTMTPPEKEKFGVLFKDWIDLEGVSPEELKKRLTGPIETLAQKDQDSLIDMFRTQLMTDRIDPGTGKVIAGIKPEVLQRAKLTLANPVRAEMVEGGARNYIDDLAEQQLANNGIELTVGEDVIAHLVEKNNVPGRGVRLVQTAIKDNVGERISDAKLNGEIQRGDVAAARMEDGAIVLDITRP